MKLISRKAGISCEKTMYLGNIKKSGISIYEMRSCMGKGLFKEVLKGLRLQLFFCGNIIPGTWKIQQNTLHK